MAYPNSLDSFTNPLATQKLNSPSHSGIETAQNTALSALEQYVGTIGSTSTTSLTYLLNHIPATGLVGTVPVSGGGTGQITASAAFLALAPALSTGTASKDLTNNGSVISWSTLPRMSINSSEIYAASSTGNDTYVVTLAPVPSAYTAGMVVNFKADVANTGPATLNVNGLGAVTIVKNVSTALYDGDIAAGQIVSVLYDGVNFQMKSPSSNSNSFLGLFKNGATTKDAADVSATQNIAHGLGVIPKKVRITAMLTGGANQFACISFTTYNGITQSSNSLYVTNTTTQSSSTAFRINIATGAGDAYSAGVVTFDATNIIITWTKTGSPTGVHNLLWEAEA